jgi:hypothetical protein
LFSVSYNILLEKKRERKKRKIGRMKKEGGLQENEKEV